MNRGFAKPRRPDPVPPGTPDNVRQRFLAWLRYRRYTDRPGGCWGIYQHAVETDDQRRSEGLRRNRQNGRTGKYFPPGTPYKIQRQYYRFIYTVGRCSFRAWFAWATCKGPHPLKVLGG
jgi:hypothetical protein